MKREETEKFAENIKELMQEKGLNSKKLSRAVGISESTISGWLTFVNFISLKHLIILADYFNCTLEYLLGRNENNYNFFAAAAVPFPLRLREAMKKNGYSRYSFVKNTRFTEAHIYKWDKGALPQLSVLVELASIFDCTLDYLAGREA